MTNLPTSLDELHGRRAARWIRESTTEQFDAYGPDGQRERQDSAIGRWQLADTGLVYEVAVSGKIAWRSPAMLRMLDDARAGAFDVLVVGYSDRWQRNLRRTLEILEDVLHPAGVAVLFADRRLLSSDPDEWDELVAEATAAERYIRHMAGRITDGFAAKFRRFGDQAGTPPMGFRRAVELPHVLEIDEASIERAVDVFRRYAGGSLSMRELAAATGLGYELVVKMLRNPIYNGWARRHRGPREERQPAPWRADPPVSDDLWRRCADLRASRLRGGGPSTRGAEDLLRGIVHCAGCGRRIRANGTMGGGRRQRLHPDPCEAWGQASVSADAWERLIAGQLAGVVLGDQAVARVRAVLATPVTQPIDTTATRIERRIRELALEHAAQAIGDAEYLAGVAALRAELEAARTARPPAIDPDRALGRIRELERAWRSATAREQAELVHGIYARVEALGSRIAAVTLTPAAYEIGLDQVMPEWVRLEERPRQGSGTQEQTARILIRGRRERLEQARRTA